MILQFMNNTKVISLKTGRANLTDGVFSLMHENKYSRDW